MPVRELDGVPVRDDDGVVVCDDDGVRVRDDEGVLVWVPVVVGVEAADEEADAGAASCGFSATLRKAVYGGGVARRTTVVIWL